MKANFVYSDLNPCGGGERLTLLTMQAVLDLGFDIDLTTLDRPDITKLENAYGKDVASTIKSVKKINVLRIFDEQSIRNNIEKNSYDLIINTHGDLDPYYSESLSKNNAITYCHFPTAKSYIQSGDRIYLERHLKINRAFLQSSNNETVHGKHNSNIHVGDGFNLPKYLRWLKDIYDNMMKNSTLITNSEFSRRAISEAYGINHIIVLSPPVDIQTFRNSVLLPSSKNGNGDDKRDDLIVVVCRIDSSKRVENAVMFAKLLKENDIGKGMIIAGNLDPYNYDYYLYLKRMIFDFGLIDYVKFEIDASFDRLLSILKKSKVYFHPRSGEHFGMSIVEAMSAGLIPIVSDVGGQTEFVPSKYHFRTLEQATQIASSAFDVSYSERIKISNSVSKFSIPNYITNFQRVVNGMLVK